MGAILSIIGGSELVQWCHGAPGILILLSTIIQWSHKDPKNNLDTALYDTLATSLRAGARLVYRHGLLRKGLGLCHGVAGSVFALLAASDALDLSINPHPSLDTRMSDGPAPSNSVPGEHPQWAARRDGCA
ncbi:hypothetical protein BDZ94DRAFT_1325422 [Collybia nuda]|uniref:Uncharacterized protein n=1 Tax=Collybia nuda TaxID=64659 RepID=A0A9P6CEZ6_9AGAR|nr:hypothetical protein BDZ94DRAFT_1325422 [Collybia nuda]